MVTEINLKLYYRVKYNQINMMKKRGFFIPKDEEIIVSSEFNSLESYTYFKSKYVPTDGISFIQDKLSSIYDYKNKNDKTTTRVLFVREEDETKDEILTDTTNMIKALINREPDIKNIILITRVKFRSANLTDLTNLVSYNIQVFLHSELFHDPTQHKLQPEFEILSISDSKKFLQQSPDTKNIKLLCFDDPVIKFLGGVFNQVVRVKRTLSYISQVEYSIEYRLISKQSIFEFIKKETKKKI